MKFDRYEILVNHYKAQILSWDWEKIKDNALTNCRADDDNNVVYGQAWLGTALGLYPSGKIYTFWTTNQKRSDIIKDECFREALEAIAEVNGMFIDYSEDGDFLALTSVDVADQVKGYITQKDQELGEEILGV